MKKWISAFFITSALFATAAHASSWEFDGPKLPTQDSGNSWSFDEVETHTQAQSASSPSWTFEG